MATKRCQPPPYGCGELKDVKLFRRDYNNADKRTVLCITCLNRYRRERYKKNQAEIPDDYRLVCKRCGHEGHHSEFSKGNRADGFSGHCKVCTNEIARLKRNDPTHRAKNLTDQCRARAKKKKVPFTVTAEDIEARLRAGHCEETGIPFTLDDPRGPFSPSIDRVDNSQGYLAENIKLVVNAWNLAKNQWSTEQLLAMVGAYYRHHG